MRSGGVGTLGGGGGGGGWGEGGGGCGGRLELSDFKWSRDEEISNFPPGCVSVGRCAPRCTGTYSSTRINHRCQPQVTGAAAGPRRSAAAGGKAGAGNVWHCIFFSYPPPNPRYAMLEE